MKKLTLTIAFIGTNILTYVTFSSAQKGFRLGVEGTPQCSFMMNKDDDVDPNYKAMTTFNGSFGFTTHYDITETMGLGVNTIYSFQGQHFKVNETERVKKTEYLKVPLMLTYNKALNSNFMFIAKTGPQFGLLTNSRFTDKDGNDVISDHSEAYEKWDFGAVVNAGIGININENFCIDASIRCDYGFTDAEDKDYPRKINTPLAVSNSNGHTNANRATTNNVTGGFSIGLRHLFD